MTATCEVCGKKLHKRGGKRYCSFACRNVGMVKRKDVEHVCAVCGMTFVVNARKRAGYTRKLCSMACVGESNRRRITGTRTVVWETVKCKTCGKQIERKVSDLKKNYCSRVCRGNRVRPVVLEFPDGSSLVVRSRWEAVFIQDYLELLGKRWLYEPETFWLENGTRYTPDFYLPDEDLWVEVKGFLTEISAEKMSLFKQTGRKLLIADETFMLSVGVNLTQKMLDARFPRHASVGNH